MLSVLADKFTTMILTAPFALLMFPNKRLKTALFCSERRAEHLLAGPNTQQQLAVSGSKITVLYHYL